MNAQLPGQPVCNAPVAAAASGTRPRSHNAPLVNIRCCPAFICLFTASSSKLHIELLPLKFPETSRFFGPRQLLDDFEVVLIIIFLVDPHNTRHLRAQPHAYPGLLTCKHWCANFDLPDHSTLSNLCQTGESVYQLLFAPASFGAGPPWQF